MTALAKEVEVPLLTPRRLKESFEHKGDKQHVAIYSTFQQRRLYRVFRSQLMSK